MMLWTYCNKVQKLLKIDLKIAKLAKFGLISSIVCYSLPWQLSIWFCKVFYFIIMQYKGLTINMMLWTNCTKLQKMLKIDLKMAKIAKLGKMSLVVCYLLPWQLGIWFCKAFYFWIPPNKSCSLCIMIRHIYINLHKLPKVDLKNPKNAIFEFCSSVVYSLLPWQQHKQLIQLIAWLKL